jgi:hypothetical protein
MAHRTDFDLNAACADWRARLAATSGFRLQDTDELEGHLRDSVADLAGRGLSVEEAFWVAVRRLGSPEPLAAEFTKVHPGAAWIRRLLWVIAGSVALKLGGVVAFCVSDGALACCVWAGWTPSWLGPAAAGLHLVVVAASLAVLWHVVANGRFRPDGWVRWGRSQPFLAGLALAGALALMSFLGGVGQVALVRVMPMNDLGSIFLWKSIVNIATGVLLLPSLLLWAIHRERQAGQ